MIPIGDLLKDKRIPKPRPGNFEGLPTRERRKPTRFYVDNEFFKLGYAKIFRRRRVLDVYCVLAKHANSKTQSCFPSISTIMREAGITNRNTVVDAIRLLEAFGLIYVEHSKGWRPNEYLLLRTSAWKPTNSISIDTVLQRKRWKKTVSDKKENGIKTNP